MTAIEQSPSHNQQSVLCFKASPNNQTRHFIGGISAGEYKHMVLSPNNSRQAFGSENSKWHSISDIPQSYSEYWNSRPFLIAVDSTLDKKTKPFWKNVTSWFSGKNSAQQDTLHKKTENQAIPFQSSQAKSDLGLARQNQLMRVPFYPKNTIVLLSEQLGFFDNDQPLKNLKNNIIQVHEEHQKEGWDGYGAKPIQNLPQALQFAKVLFQESRLLVEQVDIIPENDGAICFEWFISNERHIAVSTKNDTLIYHYQIGIEKACGETNFAGRQMLLEKIKEVIR